MGRVGDLVTPQDLAVGLQLEPYQLLLDHDPLLLVLFPQFVVGISLVLHRVLELLVELCVLGLDEILEPLKEINERLSFTVLQDLSDKFSERWGVGGLVKDLFRECGDILPIQDVLLFGVRLLSHY